MKTKVNEVPLVGPRGRKELLNKINELEEKVAELASNPPAPTDMAKMLTIPNFSGGSTEATTEEEFCGKIGITTQDFRALLNGDYQFVKFPLYDSQAFLMNITDKARITFVYINDADPDEISLAPVAILDAKYSGENYAISEY